MQGECSIQRNVLYREMFYTGKCSIRRNVLYGESVLYRENVLYGGNVLYIGVRKKEWYRRLFERRKRLCASEFWDIWCLFHAHGIGSTFLPNYVYLCVKQLPLSPRDRWGHLSCDGRSSITYPSIPLSIGLGIESWMDNWTLTWNIRYKGAQNARVVWCLEDGGRCCRWRCRWRRNLQMMTADDRMTMTLALDEPCIDSEDDHAWKRRSLWA